MALLPNHKNNQLNTWALYLAQFSSNMWVVHKPGRVHCNTNMLSRLQQKQAAEENTAEVPAAITPAFLLTEIHINPTLQDYIAAALPTDPYFHGIIKVAL